MFVFSFQWPLHRLKSMQIVFLFDYQILNDYLKEPWKYIRIFVKQIIPFVQKCLAKKDVLYFFWRYFWWFAHGGSNWRTAILILNKAAERCEPQRSKKHIKQTAATWFQDSISVFSSVTSACRPVLGESFLLYIAVISKYKLETSGFGKSHIKSTKQHSMILGMEEWSLSWSGETFWYLNPCVGVEYSWVVYYDS